MLVHAFMEIPEEEMDRIDPRLPAKISVMMKSSEGEKPYVKEYESTVAPFTPINAQDIKLLTESVNENDVVIFKYPADADIDDIPLIRDILKAEFPDNKILGLVNDIELLVQNEQEAVDLLESMIAHIRIAGPAAEQKKIIL